MVKKLPEVSAGARVWPLCWEGPLQKGMATHSSIFTWEIPWTEEPDRLQSIGLQSQTQPSWASLIAQLVKNVPAIQETWFDSWVGNIHWRDRLRTPVFLGFPGGSAGKESACNVGHQASIPGLGRAPGEGKGYPLQYSSLENSMDCIVHGVAELDTTEWLSLSLVTKQQQQKKE